MREILLSFGLIIALGAAFRRLRPMGTDADAARDVLNTFVLNIFLPALCIKTMYQSQIDLEAALLPAAAWITTLLALALASGTYFLFGKKMHFSPQEKGVLLLASAFGNVTYLGLPVLTVLFGSGAAKYALFYDLLATTPLLWLVGASLASRYGGGEGFALADSVKAIVSLPPLWGIFSGIALRVFGVPLPSFVLRTMDMLGGLVVPLMIFSIGLALTFPKVKHAYAIIPALIIKLVISPAIAFLAAKVLGLSGIALASGTIEGAMPSMVLTILVAARFKLDVPLSAFIIVVSTTLSFFTLPTVIFVANHLMGM